MWKFKTLKVFLISLIGWITIIILRILFISYCLSYPIFIVFILLSLNRKGLWDHIQVLTHRTRSTPSSLGPSHTESALSRHSPTGASVSHLHLLAGRPAFCESRFPIPTSPNPLILWPSGTTDSVFVRTFRTGNDKFTVGGPSDGTALFWPANSSRLTPPTRLRLSKHHHQFPWGNHTKFLHKQNVWLVSGSRSRSS